jgi:hypothetical protein
MSRSNAPGRRGTRRTKGRSQERTTFAYLLDYEGLRLELADAPPRLGDDDHIWFTTTFINYCGRHGGRRPITARVEVSIPGSRIEDHVKQALSQDIDGAAAALQRGESYETPEGERQLVWLSVTVTSPGGDVTRARRRATVPDVPRIEQRPTDQEGDAPSPRSPLIELRLPSRLPLEALAQLHEALDQVRASAVGDPEFRRMALEVIEDCARGLRTIAPATPRTGPRAEPPRVGHPLVEKLAALWDEREAIPRPELVRQFQQILDRFHEDKTLGSYEKNLTATRWINRLATKSRMKLLFEERAVTLRCEDRGETGTFIARLGGRNGKAVPGSNSPEFPCVKAVAL